MLDSVYSSEVGTDANLAIASNFQKTMKLFLIKANITGFCFVFLSREKSYFEVLVVMENGILNKPFKTLKLLKLTRYGYIDVSTF